MFELNKYKGTLKSPQEMSVSELCEYTFWVSQYLEWCHSYEGREVLHAHRKQQAAPYIIELRNRRERDLKAQVP